jgi:CRP-like cAMP-binding protein
MSGMRELGLDFVAEGNWEKALAFFAEAVRRQPHDHRSRMLAARCYAKLGENERAVTVLQACAEGLLRRDYLLSAIAACRQALPLAPREKRIRETLARIHARAARMVVGKASVPPPLPPESLYDGQVSDDLMTLTGSELSDKAISVLASADGGGPEASEARPPLPLFADLDREAFIDLVELLEYRELQDGEAICTEGARGDRIYVLVAGKAEVSRRVEGQEKRLAFLGGGSIFGEMSLLTGAPPTSTVRCVGEADVLVIKRRHLNELARNHPAVPQILATFAQTRMARNIVATSPLFTPVPEADRAHLLSRFTFKGLQPDEKVIAEGDPVTALVLVLAGELVVQKEDPGGGVVSLGVLREGEVAGEIALLKGLRATATVVATRKTAVATLERTAFESLLKSYPLIRDYLDGLSDRRLKQIGEAMRPIEVLDADELVVDG